MLQHVPDSTLSFCRRLLHQSVAVSLSARLSAAWAFPLVALTMIPCCRLDHRHTFDFLWSWAIKIPIVLAISLSGSLGLNPPGWEHGLRKSHCVRSEGPVLALGAQRPHIGDSALTPWQSDSCFLVKIACLCAITQITELSPWVRLSLPCSQGSVTGQEVGIKTLIALLLFLQSWWIVYVSVSWGVSCGHGWWHLPLALLQEIASQGSYSCMFS